MRQRGLHWTDFREIWYWGLLWKFIGTAWKSGKNIGEFAWRPKHVLLLPATLNCHKSALCDRNCIWLLGQPRKYKQQRTRRSVTLYVRCLSCLYIFFGRHSEQKSIDRPSVRLFHDTAEAAFCPLWHWKVYGTRTSQACLVNIMLWNLRDIKCNIEFIQLFRLFITYVGKKGDPTVLFTSEEHGSIAGRDRKFSFCEYI